MSRAKKNSPTSPAHYKTGGLEVVEIWRKKLTPEEFKGACKANILKYIFRADNKNGIEDYEKAMQYLKFLIEAERRNKDENSEHISDK